MLDFEELSENDKHGLLWATEAAKDSECLSRKVGAAILKDTESAGWRNAPPYPLKSCADNGSCDDNARGQCTRCRHAEMYAVDELRDFCATGGTLSPSLTLYVSCPPCHSCALEIIMAGIRRVVCYSHPKTDAMALARLAEANVEVIIVCR